jgi:hypothetical protein
VSPKGVRNSPCQKTNQTTTSGGCNKLIRLVQIIGICAELELLVIPSRKCAINLSTNPCPVYSNLTLVVINIIIIIFYNFLYIQ